jgi:ADP-ribosylglycohydrolase
VQWGAKGTHDQPPGTWSDDGGLMLALLDSLLEVGFDPEDQGRRALAWYETSAYKPGPVFDVGITTSRALARLKAGTLALQAGGLGERDNGNGSLMRILPVALADPAATIAEVANQGAAASRLTHGHPRSQAACSVYCVVARRLLEGEVDERAALAAAIHQVGREGSPEVRSELGNLTGYERRTGDGYVLDSFWSAWSAFLTTESYSAAVEKAIRLGNDTDTTACIAGGLAGVRWGVRSIPIEWRRGMRGQEIAQPLIDRLVARWIAAGRC